jgi:hypothetical protein
MEVVSKKNSERCVRISATHIVPGWGCCQCMMYNGYQRETCRKCGHRPCYEFEHGEIVPGAVEGRGLAPIRLGIDVLKPKLPEGQVIVRIGGKSSSCGNHDLVDSEGQLLRSDGGYDAVPATICRKCRELVAVHVGRESSVEDGDCEQVGAG